MGIRIEWDDEAKTIIRHIYEGTWTIEHYYGLIDENYRQIDSVNHRVDIINDLRAMIGVPPGMAAAIRYAARKAHPNEGINVIVASPKYVQLLVEATNKSVADFTKVIHKPTLEEAREVIANYRAANPELYGGQNA